MGDITEKNHLQIHDQPLLSHDSFTLDEETSEVCGQPVSGVQSDGQVRELSERDPSDPQVHNVSANGRTPVPVAARSKA